MKYFTTFALVFSAILSSCSPTKTMVDTSCSGYRNPEFNREYITDRGIGIMPVLGEAEREQYRRPMGDAIFVEFQNSFGSNVKSTRDVINILNEHDISDDYAKAINNFTISGIIPMDLIQNLGKALEVNYLLYTRLLTAKEYAEISISTYKSKTVNIDELYVQTQVWDTNLGDVVWEGKGGIAKLPNDQSDVVLETAKGLANVLGTDLGQGPCQEPGELARALQAATTNTSLIIAGVSLGVFLLVTVGFLL